MFRLMTANDKEKYFEMSRQFYSSGAALNEIDDKKREFFWNEILNAKQVKGYIIETDGKISGYALTVNYPSQEFGGNVLWIDELFVLPEFRNRGIARSFFEFAEGLSEKIALRLEVEPDNEKAVKLYKSLGFKPLPYLQMIKIQEDL